MKRLALLSIIAFVVVLASGCGGMPKPTVQATPNAKGTVNVRFDVVATNYDSSWDNEKVKLIVRQIWVNNAGVQTNDESVGEKGYFGPQADKRGLIQLKDAKGNETRNVHLSFDLKSGSDPLNLNSSASKDFEWGMGSAAESDLLILVAISRVSNNTYAIDAAYAVDLENGHMEQLLPRNK